MTVAEIKDKLEIALSRNTVEISSLCAGVLHLKYSGVLNPSREDTLKLLNLRTWAERYYLSLEEVVTVLLKDWQARMKIRKTSRVTLTVRLLVNKRSHSVLQEYIKRTYPNKENEGILKDNFRDKILPASTGLDLDNPLTFVADYKKHIADLRAVDKVIETKFKRRNWRGLPW